MTARGEPNGLPTWVVCEAPPVTIRDAGALLVLVNVNDPVAVPALTDMEYVPVELFAVNVGAIAVPAEFVVIVALGPAPGAANVPEGPEAGAVNVTCVPGTAVPFASRTVTVNGLAKGVPIGAPWPDVVVPSVIVAGGPALFIWYPVVPPDVDATTTKLPGVVPAVNAGAVASPLPFVVTEADVTPPANVPEAPVLGAVNVTDVPTTGAPVVGFTTDA